MHANGLRRRVAEVSSHLDFAAIFPRMNLLFGAGRASRGAAGDDAADEDADDEDDELCVAVGMRFAYSVERKTRGGRIKTEAGFRARRARSASRRSSLPFPEFGA